MPRNLLFFVLILSSCSHRSSLNTVTYKYEDSPNEEKIFVEFNNSLTKSICIFSQYWPSENGIEDSDGKIFQIFINNDIYQIENYNEGYPPSNKLIKVSPGKTIRSFLRYDHFRIPTKYYKSEKNVRIKPEWKFC